MFYASPGRFLCVVTTDMGFKCSGWKLEANVNAEKDRRMNEWPRGQGKERDAHRGGGGGWKGRGGGRQ